VDFFLSFENTEAGKKKKSAPLFQEWNIEIPQFLNSNHRLFKSLVPDLIKEYHITGHCWYGY